jgi:hypothetical protein
MLLTPSRADVLAEPIDGLERALFQDYRGHEHDWAQAVSSTLGDVHQALRLHAAACEAPDGLFSKVDLTRPTLTRRVALLRKEHSDLFECARQLERQLQSAGEVFQPSAVRNLSTPLPEPQRLPAVPDFGMLRQQTEKLLADLQHHVEEEAKLLLESVNTDIGVGD